MEMIRNERLARWGEQAARSIPITGTITARHAERRLREAMGRITERSRDENAPAWYADNEYMARREGSLAVQAFHNAGRLRRGPEGSALVMLCRQLVQAGPITEERVEEFLTGARRTDVLPENEAALVGAALRMAVIQELGREDVDGARAGELFTSLRTLSEMDLTHALERSDPVDALLRQDDVYPQMDETSRAVYRAKCQKLAKKHGVSAVKEAQTALDKGLHNYLFPQTPYTGAGYIAVQVLLTVSLSLFDGAAAGRVWTAALVLLPVSELVRSVMDGVLLRLVKPRWLPRLELSEGVGRKGRTVCVVSTLLTDSGTGRSLAKRIEEYRLASRDCGSELLFAILADLPDGKTYPDPDGAERLEELKCAIDGLNQTYGGGFFLLTRQPVWNETEKVFTPWERKRGAVMELARMVQGRPHGLQCMAGDSRKLYARYILCLDGDTRLVPGAARALIGAAMHPLNRPVVENRMVVRGHGVLHPRMSVELDKALATDFARIWAGQGGTDPYGAPTGELFTDLFDRGGFSGKGIIDAEAYLACLENRFADNRILSHDALEGAYLRGAYLGDVELTDGAPVTDGAWFRRMHRWTRGDWQNLPWLFKAGQGLALLDRWRLFDNLCRSLVTPGTLACFLCSFFLPGTRFVGIAALVCLGAEAVRAAFAGLFSRTGDVRMRCYSGVLRGLGGSFTRLLARLIFLPWEAFTCASAMVTALWRMGISHRHMLQWVPAAQTEGIGKQPAAMWFSVATGAFLLFFAPGPAGKASGVVWLCAPLFAYITGLPQIPRNDLTDSDRTFLRNSAHAIWSYFAQYCNRENHWLPPDNVQVQPPKGEARRTSPTNIGMALVSALASMELKLTPETEAMTLIERILSTLERLPKWRGHLYNWYDTGTCAPLQPAYVSTVDSGNLCASLICLSHGLKAHGRPDLAERSAVLAANMDLAALYDEKRKLFRIGIDPASETVSPGHYDLMASEARLTSYLACARGDVPVRHWQALSRARLSLDGWRGLASWSGSMFEYLMPELFLPLVNGSMLWETGRFCLYAQRRRGAAADAPWGNSESAFFSLDAGMDYRYKAHGTGALALRRDMDGELVVAPYASFLALCVHPKAAVKNLRRLKRMGMYGEFGFYESLDLTPGRTGKKGEAVACFMSHHLGMSLCAAANCLTGGIMRQYFMAEPACAAFRSLLAERVPLGGAVLRRSRSPVTRPPESRPDRPVFIWEGKGMDPAAPAWLPLSNGVYSLQVCDDGQCRAQTAGLLMYRPEGFSLFVDGIALNPSRQAAVFCPWRYEAGSVTFTAQQGDNVVSSTIATASGECGELRRVTGPSGGRLEIRFEPVLAREADYAAHPAFCRLGLEVTAQGGMVLVRRIARGGLPEVWQCMAATVPLRIIRGSGWQMSDAVVIQAALPEGGCGALALCFGRSREEAADGAQRILSGGNADMVASMASLLGMGAEGIRAAFALCSSICSPRVRAHQECTRQALWKQGLSGDIPIVYVHVNKDLDEARRMIKRHALLTACGVRSDLVIDTGEEGAYLHPATESLRRYLEKYGLAGFEGVKGGIHFAGGEAVAASALLPNPVRDRESVRQPALHPVGERGDTVPEIAYITGGAVSFATPPLPPRAWCNVISNGMFGFLASDSGTGFMWRENARECPVNPWMNDPMAVRGGETLELFADQSRQSLFADGRTPCRVVHGFGWSRWEHENCAVTAFVPVDCRARILMIEGGEQSYIGWHLPLALAPDPMDAVCTVTGYEDGCLTAENPRSLYPGAVFRAAFSARLSGFTGDEAAWMEGRLSGVTGAGLRPCFGALWKGGGISVVACGFEDAETLKALANPDRAAQELLRVRDKWRTALGRVRFKTPDEDLNRMMNGWAAYQALSCRVLGRTSIYQSGGAYGFRDQLQDVVNLIPIDPVLAKDHIALCCTRQFLEGDVLHWWHETPSGPKGIRSRCSDDLLWLPWALCEYTEKTGDLALCQQMAPWLEGTALRPEETDRYFAHAAAEAEDTVLEHACRAVDRVLRRGSGPHGLLLTGSGDWNDGMDKVGGESVWLTWFFVHVADRLAAVMSRCGRRDGEKYAKAAGKYAQAADHAWDGSWYLRGWWQDGATLGSAGSPACAIDSIAQSWAAFCPQAERSRVHTALMACVERLYDPAYGITRLFAPPFGDGDRDPVYIRACGPGFRENGGQYTHGALWLASALLQKGFTEEGSAILLNTMPARHPANQWQAEPYVFAADVSSNEDHYGQANWSWYTGAAGWFFRVVLEDLLGIHMKDGCLTVEPTLPAGWEGYEADICGRHIQVKLGKVTIT